MSLSSLAAVQFNPPETPPIRTSLSLSTTCCAEGSTSVIRRLGDCERGAAVASFSLSLSLSFSLEAGEGSAWRPRPWSSRLEDAKCGLEKISQAGSLAQAGQADETILLLILTGKVRVQADAQYG